MKLISLRRFLCAGLAICAGLASAAPPPGLLDNSHASVRAVIATQRAVTADLMRHAGVLGTAIGLDDNDQPALVVYVDKDNAGVAAGLPERLNGSAVKVEKTDRFVAYGK